MLRRKQKSKNQPKSIDGIIRADSQKKSFWSGAKQPAITVSLVALGMLLGGLGYRFVIASNSSDDGSVLPANASVDQVISKVSEHYVLPTDEKPALATVTDKSKLTSQFFKHTQNGDRILIYQNNKIAIVYRPSINRIISVGPVSIDNPTLKQ